MFHSQLQPEAREDQHKDNAGQVSEQSCWDGLKSSFSDQGSRKKHFLPVYVSEGRGRKIQKVKKMKIAGILH